MLRYVLTAALLASAAACASGPAGPASYQLMPQSFNGTQLSSIPNVKPAPTTKLESRFPGATVVVSAAKEFNQFGASLVVAVENTGAAPLALDPANVAVSSSGAPVRVYTAAEIDEQVRSKARTVLRVADSVDENGRSGSDFEGASRQVQRDEQFNTFGGCAAGNGRCLVDSPDGGRAYRLDQSNRQANLDLATDVGTQLVQDAVMSARTLKPQSIEPGKIGGGVVVMPHPQAGQTLDITVTIAGHKHTFTYLAKPA